MIFKVTIDNHAVKTTKRNPSSVNITYLYFMRDSATIMMPLPMMLPKNSAFAWLLSNNSTSINHDHQ